MKKRILVVVGTRPEAIKMAPVILALRQEPWAEVRVLATAQHRHLLDQVLDCFKIVPDIDMDIMRPNQALSVLTARLAQQLLDDEDSYHAMTRSISPYDDHAAERIVTILREYYSG